MRYPSAIGSRPAPTAARPIVRATAKASSTTMPEERDEQERSERDAGHAEEVEEPLRLRQAVEDDRGDTDRDERHVGRRPARLEQPAAERPSPDATVLVDEGEVARAGRGGGTRP